MLFEILPTHDRFLFSILAAFTREMEDRTKNTVSISATQQWLYYCERQVRWTKIMLRWRWDKVTKPKINRRKR